MSGGSLYEVEIDMMNSKSRHNASNPGHDSTLGAPQPYFARHPHDYQHTRRPDFPSTSSQVPHETSTLPDTRIVPPVPRESVAPHLKSQPIYFTPGNSETVRTNRPVENKTQKKTLKRPDCPNVECSDFSCGRFCKIIFPGLCVAVAAAFIAVFVVYFLKHQELNENRGNFTTIKLVSCREVKAAEPDAASGIYTIYPGGIVTSVYCEMEEAGGGWTLVATVKEDNYNNLCDREDRWVVPQDSGTTSAWSSRYPFGNLESALTTDYKSEAYHLINASEIMIYHTRESPSFQDFKKMSSVRYHTMEFQKKSGCANLYQYYKIHPLSVKQNLLREFRQKLSSLSDNIIDNFETWYYYEYTIKNGINDSNIQNNIYNLNFYGENKTTPLQFNEILETNRFGETNNIHSLYSIVTGPVLHAFQLIVNSNYEIQQFEIRVGTEHGRNWIVNSGTLSEGNFTMKYCWLRSTNNISNVTMCNIAYVISNENSWSSSQNTDIECNHASVDVSHYLIQTTNTKNVLMGYSLLTSSKGNESNHLDVLKLILGSFTTIDFLNRFNSDTVPIPVSFTQGYKGLLESKLPAKYRDESEAGYLQLGAYNAAGYPTAICPGVRTWSLQPEYLCIGGVAHDRTKDFTCNDFRGWNGRENITGTSQMDKDSTIAIFYK